VAARLVERDPVVWLSRSWTTRPRRPGEREDAYNFVDRPRFEDAVTAGSFLEWAEFLGHLYGTPSPEPPAGRDVILEIDLQGARQVKALYPDAVLVLLVPPSPEVQSERLRRRGDDEEEITRRLAKGAEEVEQGKALTPYVVVNGDVDQATAAVAGILEVHRRAAQAPPGGEPREGA
jgi:guanylate kinase